LFLNAVKLPLRGPVDNTARDILGGLRSACTYVGASRLKGTAQAPAQPVTGY
jgi:IMP dehydrogenase/GMP reductase